MNTKVQPMPEILPKGDYSLTIVDAMAVQCPIGNDPYESYPGLKILSIVDGTEILVSDTLVFDRREVAFRKSVGLLDPQFLLPEIDPKSLVGKKFEACLSTVSHVVIIEYYLITPELARQRGGWVSFDEGPFTHHEG